MSEMTMTTSKGDIVFEMFDDDAPKTVGNMRDLAEKGYYDGLSFHRIIRDFMIQGGCPQGTGTGGPGYEFEDEIHPDLRFDRPYLLAMANAGPGTNGSQFFITVGPTPHLNFKHTIFGEVADEESRKVVDAIATMRTVNDKPVQDVVIQSISVERR
jgi:peptidyl-prolyl cis-trans isomerase A (cyclophilin A)